MSIARKSADWLAEDMAAVFTVSIDRVQATDLDVTVMVTDTGDFLASDEEGERVVTVPAGALSADFAAAVVDDNVDERDGSILAQVLRGTGYTRSMSARSDTARVSDNDGVPTVSVSGPLPSSVPEAFFRTQNFTVKANPPPAANITVTLQVDTTGGAASKATGTGSQTIVIPTSGSATHGVTVVDDDTDEPDGKITVTVQSGAGYLVARQVQDSAAAVWVGDDDPTSVTLAGTAGNLAESQTKALTLTLGRGLVKYEGLTEKLTVPLTFGGTATRGVDYTMAGTPATGVAYNNLDSGSAEVVFTGPETGATAKVATITLTAVADEVAESPPETVAISLGKLDHYGLGGKFGVVGTNELAEFGIEDLSADGVTVSTGSLALTERGEAKTYTLVLNTDPGADVVVTVASNDTSAVVVDTDGDMEGNQDELTFIHGEAGNWGKPQTVTVRTVNDGDAAAETVTISHTAAVASGNNNPYDGIDIEPVTVTITDAGHGLAVSDATLSVAERDNTASYTIALKSDPGGTVEVTPRTGDAAKAAVSGALTFSGSDWSAPQEVTVTGKSPGPVTVTHDITTGTTDYPAAMSLGPVSVTVTALPRVGMKVTGIAVEEGDNAEIVVVLSNSADADVTIPLILRDINTAAGTDYTVPDPASVTIPAGQTEATFSIPILADGLPERREDFRVWIDKGNLPAGVLPGTPEYTGVSIDATDGVTVYPDKLDLAERPATAPASNRTYMLVLNTDPGADVTVTVTSGDTGAVEVDTDSDMAGDQGTLTFTHGSSGNWYEWQTVRVRAVIDGDLSNETVTISHAATVMSDTNNSYHGIHIEPVTVTLVADAGRGVALSDKMILVKDGDGTRTYEIVLKSDPGGTVTVLPESGDTTKATVSGAVSFDSTDWYTPKPVTVTGKGLGSVTVTHSITAGTIDYPTSLPVPSVSVTVDTDTRPKVDLSIEDSDGKMEEGGFTEYYATLTGDTLPMDSSIPMTVSGVDATDYYVADHIFVKLRRAGGDASLEIISDDLDEPNETLTLAFGALPGGLRAGAVTSVEIGIVDKNPTAVTLARMAGETGAIDENAGIAAFTITLGRSLIAGETVTAPLALSGTGITGDDYTVRLKTGASLNGGVTLLTADPHSAAAPAVQFTGTGSDVSASTVGTATLELVAKDDSLDEGQSETVTLALGRVASNLDRVTGTGIAGTTPTGTAVVTITDDDIARGISLTETGDGTAVRENGTTDTYMVMLESRPTHDVTVTVTAGAGIEVGTTGSPTPADSKTLTFTPTNWDDEQPVTVHALDNQVDDASRREVKISHASVSSDPLYSGLAALPLAVVVADDDATQVTLAAPEGDVLEDGGSKVVTVTLGRALEDGESLTVPLTFGGAAGRGADYAVSVKEDQASHGVTYTNLESDAASVTFTGIWGASPSASFTIESIADAIDEGASEAVTVALGALDGDSGTGLEGGASGSGDASFAITDDDTAGVTVGASAVTVQGGAEASYTLRLTSEPVGAVAVTPTSDDDEVVGITAIEGTSDKWAVFDADNWQVPQTVTVEGVAAGGPVNITHAVTYAAGGGYGTDLSIDPVAVTVSAATRPVLNLSLAGDALAEGGWTELTLSVTGAAQRFAVDTADLLSVSGVDAADYRLDLPVRIAFRAPDYSQTVRLFALPDDADEQNETLAVGFGSGFPETLAQGTEAVATVIDGNPTPVAFALAGEDELLEGEETSVTVTLGRQLLAGETVTAPLTVAGAHVDASDYTLSLNAGGSSSGVSLNTSAPYSTDEPAVVFTGSDGAVVDKATLDLAALEDGVAETSEAFTLWMGTLDSNLDLESGSGVSGTVAKGESAVIQLRDPVAPADPGVSVSPTALTVVENGAPGRYHLWLDSDPGQTVTVDITSGDAGRVRVEPAQLTFTASGDTIWSEAQAVEVTALADADAIQGNDVTITHAVSGYTGVSSVPDVSVTVRDAGHGVMASTRALQLSEGGTAEYKLRLQSRPTHAVTLTPRVSDSGAVLRAGAAVTFQPNEWNTEKTIEVAGLSPGRATVSHEVKSVARGYGGDGSSEGAEYGVAAISVTVDTAPARISGASFTVAPVAASVVGGNAAAFTVSAANALGGDVAVEVIIGDGGDVIAAGEFQKRKIIVPAGGNGRFSVGTKPFSEDRPDGAVTAVLATRYGGATARVAVVDNIATPVSLTFGDDLSLREQAPGDKASVTVTLGRDLAAGEVVDVPLAFATTDGVALPGAAQPHITVSARGTGVTLQGATTAVPVVRFTGGAGVERVATVEMAATATGDANLTDDAFTVGLGDLAAATLGTTVSGGVVATGGSNQARLTLVDNQEAFEVSLAGGGDLVLVEQLPSDTATVTVTLERDLTAGEIVDVPLAFASTSGVALPGASQPHIQVLSATGAGVTLRDATTTAPVVRFTGGAGTGQVATVEMAATNREDGDTSDDTFTVGLGNLDDGGLGTNVGEAVTAAAGDNLATLTLFDDDNPFTVSLTGGSDLTILEESSSDRASVKVTLERDLEAGEVVEVPLAFSTTSGLSLPGGSRPHIQVLSATGAGVSLHDAAIASPKVRFTGGSGAEQVAEVRIGATGQDDGNTTDDTFTVALGNLSDASLQTQLTGTVTASSASNAAVLTLLDNDVGVAISDASAAEGEALVFTVTLPNAAPAGGVTVRYAIAEGTGGAVYSRATAPDDFRGARGGAVTIAEGQSSGTISVPTVDDNVYESDHRFTVQLTSSTHGPLHPTDYEAVGTITDDADLPEYVFESGQYRVSEGGTVRLSVAQGGSTTSLLPAVVSYAPAGDGDTAGAGDYTGASGSLTFAPGGPTRQRFVVQAVDDGVSDIGEHVMLALTAGAHAKIGAAATTRVEIADANPVTVGVEAAEEVHEGETVVFTLSADAAVENDLPLKVRVTQGGNYVTPTAIREYDLVLAGGSSSVTLPIGTSDNNGDEADGHVRAVLLPGDGYDIDASRVLSTVVIDGAEPVVSVSAAAPEVGEGSDAGFTVSADFAPANDVTVSLTVAQQGDVAAAGETGSKQVTLLAGQTEATYAVRTDDDATAEDPGAVKVSLVAGAGYALSAEASTASVVVTDDDGSPSAITLSVDTDTVAEDGGPKTVRVTATIDGGARFDSDRAVTVKVGEPGDSAVEGTDYADVPDQTITIREGAASGHVEFTLTPTDDAAQESEETISLTGALAGVTFKDAVIRLLDDEAPEVRIEAKKATVTEGEAATFTVRLLGSTVAPVTVSYAVSGTGGYVAAATGSVVVPVSGSAEITTAATTDVAGDTPDGTLTVAAAAGTGYRVTDSSASTIEVADDEPTIVSIRGSGSMTEGDPTKTGELVVALSRALVEGERVTVPLRFATKARDFLSGALNRRDVVVHATGADIGTLTDTQQLASGVRLFGPGSAELAGQRTPPNAANYAVEFKGGPGTEHSATLKLTARAERSPNDQTDAKVTVNFRVLNSAALTNVGGGIEADRRQNGALFRVIDVDKLVLSTGWLAVTEGGTADYKVKFDGKTQAPSQNVTVTVTAGSGARVSTAGSTTPAASKTLTFTRSNWKNAQTVTVTADEDGVDDQGRSVVIGHTVASADARYQNQKARELTVKVADNDATTVVLAGAAGNLVKGQTRDLTVTLGRGLVRGETLRVPLTFGGTAVRGTDYTMAGTTAAGVAYNNLNTGTASVVFTGPDSGATATIATLTLTAAKVGTAEATSETVDIGFGTLVHTGLDGGADATDSLAGFSIEDVTYGLVFTESGAGTTVSEEGAADSYDIKLETEPSHDVTVTVTAGAGVRVNKAGGTVGGTQTLTFTTSTWNIAQTVTVTGVDDAIDNPGDARTVAISHATSSTDMGYDIVDAGSVSVTVTDDDVPELGIAAGAAVTEGTAAGYTVNADIAPAADLTVNLDVVSSTGFATSGTTGAQTFTFRAGKTSESYTVSTASDSVDEPDGSVTVTLENGTGYAVASSSNAASVDVKDDDATTVTLARSGSGGIAESGGAADVTVTLGRALVAGESVTAPLSVTGATVETHYTLALKDNGGTGVSLDTTPPHGTANPAVKLSGAGARVATLIMTAVANTDNASRTVAIAYGTSARAPSSSGLSGGISTSGSASVPIIDDDATISVAAANAAEGSAVVFTVTLPEVAPSSGVTVDYSTSDGRGNNADATHQTATGADYTAAAQNATLTIAQGARTGTISIPTTQDTTYEGDHYFTLTLDSTDTFNISAIAGSATGTITDAADRPTFAFSAASTDADEDDGTLTLTVAKTGDTLVDATVSYATTDGTATGGSDFTAIDSTDLDFGASEASKTISVSLTDDSADEPAETFTVDLTAGADAQLGSTKSHTVNITDNDATRVTLAAPSTAIDEDAGTRTITVTLGRALTGDETLDVPLTFAGTAAFGDDYTLAAPNTTPTGVTYSNLASTDLAATPPTISFSGVDKAASSATVILTASDDTTDEGASESVTVGLGTLNANSGTNLDGGASGSGMASFNIDDDDDAPGGITLTVDKSSIAEDAATATVRATATVTGGTAYSSDKTVSIKVGVSTDTAIEGTDYANVADFELTINAMEMSAGKTFSLNPTDDPLDEDAEALSVTGTSGDITVTPARITITDNDTEPVLSINSPTVAESHSGETATLRFTVSLDAASGRQVTVAYAEQSGGTADSGADYQALTAGMLTFAAGDRTRDIDITVTGDADDELNETVKLRLSSAVNADLSGSGNTLDGTGTITDDDATSVVLARAGSGGIAEAGGAVDVTVTLGRALVAGESVTVPLTVTGATETTHYTLGLKGNGGTGVSLSTAAPNSAQHPQVTLSGAGARTATLTLTAVNNSDRTARTVAIAYGTSTRAPSSVGLGGGISATGSASVPILDDDAMVSTAAASAAEGGNVDFTVTLPDPAPAGGVTVGYETSNGRGKAGDAAHQTATGADYTAAPENATLKITQGQRSGTIRIKTTQDSTYEGDHYFTLTLTSTSHFNLSATAGSATGTITDAADTPSFAFAAASTTADEDDGTVALTVQKSGTTLVDATVSYQTANGTATGGSDFTAIASTDLVFKASENSKSFNVSLTDDSADEPEEAFTATLTAGADAKLASRSSQTVTISDNDATTVKLTAPTGAIDEAGGTKILTVELGRALTGDEALSVPLTFAGSATFGADYTLAAPNTTPTGVTYANLASTDLAASPPSIAFSGVDGAASTATVILTAQADATDEGDSESVTVGLGTLNASSGTNLGGGASGSGTASFDITDDDSAPTGITLTVDTTTIAENAPTATVKVTATVNGGTAYATDTTLSVKVGVDADTAVEGADYAKVADFALTINAMEMSAGKTFSLDPTDDALDEADETLSVTGTASGLTIAPARITITDNDDAPVLSIDSPSVKEKNSGATATLRFTVSLDAASGKQVTVAYAEQSGGTAISGTDYKALPAGMLTFAAGDTSKTVDVTVNGDDVDEDNETLKLRLSSPANAGFANNAATLDGTGTITDDDTAGVHFSVDTIRVEKDETSVFFVSLRSQPTADTTVTLTSSNRNVAELSASPRGQSVDLLFTPENWNMPRAVTVHGMEDGEIDLETALRSADPKYANAKTPPLRTRVIGVPTLTLTASEDHIGEGEAATFTIEADRVSAVDVPVKVEVGYVDCCIGTGEMLAKGEEGVRTVTLPRGQTSVSFKVQTADDDAVHGTGTRRGNKSINAQIVESDTYRIDHTANDDLARFTWYDSVGVGENDPVQSVPADIILSVSGPDSVMEGKTAEFTFTASKAPARDLNIDFYLGMCCDFDTTPAYAFDENVRGGFESLDVTLPAGAVTTTFSIAIVDDGRAQKHGKMSVIVSSAYDNSYDRAERPDEEALVEIVDNETGDLGVLSVADAEVREGPDAFLEFVVTLERKVGNRRVRAIGRVRDGTAGDGKDYRGTTGMVFFDPGETEKRIRVPVIDDAQAEGDETLYFELLSPEPGWIARGKALGTIRDDDGQGSTAQQEDALQPTACVSDALLADVEDRIQETGSERWTRVKNALTGQPNAVSLAEVTEIHDRRAQNGLSTDQWTPVIAALECLGSATPSSQAAPSAAMQDAAPATRQTLAPTACIAASLQSAIEGHAQETHQGAEHVRRWQRVLDTFAGAAGAQRVTRAEAEGYTDRGWQRWAPVAAALECMERAGAWWSALGVDARVRALYGEGLAAEKRAAHAAAVGRAYASLAPRVRSLAAGAAVALAGGGAHSSLAAWWDGLGCRLRRVAVGAGRTAAAESPWCRNWAALGEAERTEAKRIGRALFGSALPETAPGAQAHRAEAPGFRVEDARTTEAPGAALAFEVRLVEAAGGRTHTVTVAYASADGTATAGADYRAVSGALAFAPGETVRTVEVPVHDDGHDEGAETMTLVLSSPQGAALSRAEATGTIVNSDPMPAAWLARFGRMAAEQALDGIAKRVEAPRRAGFEGSFAGQALVFTGGGPGAAKAPGVQSPGSLSGSGPSDIDRLFGNELASGTVRKVAGRDLLLGSRFTLTGEQDTNDGSLAFWGQAAQSGFDGREGAFSLAGETTTAILGTDYARGRWLVGMALMQNAGKGGFAHSGDADPRPASRTCPAGEEEKVPCDGAVREGDGRVEAVLTAAIPYASLQASERLKLWGALGHGVGEVVLKPAMGRALKSDISWTMAATGMRGDLLPGSGLALTADALWARTSSDRTRELAASDSDVTRLRLGLEGSWTVALAGDPGSGSRGSGASVAPKLEVGLRHDGGDAETGFGVEVGGGLAWVDPTLGLSLDLSGRMLVTHDAEGLKDRGFAASLAFDPNPATKRGLSLALRQDWGGTVTGGLDALFQADPLSERTGSGATSGSRWSAEGAYGLPAFSGRFTGSPHMGLGLGSGARDYSLGWRLTPARNAPDMSFGLKATRRENDGAAPEHTLGFEINTRW